MCCLPSLILSVLSGFLTWYLHREAVNPVLRDQEHIHQGQYRASLRLIMSLSLMEDVLYSIHTMYNSVRWAPVYDYKYESSRLPAMPNTLAYAYSNSLLVRSLLHSTTRWKNSASLLMRLYHCCMIHDIFAWIKCSDHFSSFQGAKHTFIIVLPSHVSVSDTIQPMRSHIWLEE